MCQRYRKLAISIATLRTLQPLFPASGYRRARSVVPINYKWFEIWYGFCHILFIYLFSLVAKCNVLLNRTNRSVHPPGNTQKGDDVRGVNASV